MNRNKNEAGRSNKIKDFENTKTEDGIDGPDHKNLTTHVFNSKAL